MGVVIKLVDYDDDDDEENICCIYEGHNNGPNLDWIQCVHYHRWIHKTSTSDTVIYDNCLNYHRAE